MKKFLAFLLSFLIIFTTACSTSASVSFFYFNAPISLNFYDGNKLKSYSNDIEDLLKEIQSDTDTENVNSDITKFNLLKEGESVTISDTTKNILEVALEVNKLTGSVFNPFIYPLTELWQFSANTYKNNDFTLPDKEEIQLTLELCKCTDENFTLNGNQLTKLKDGVKLDLGGITKGYACDKVYEYLVQKGLKQGYISMGSSSIALFKNKYDSFWDLSLRHPDDQNKILLKIKKLSDVQVSTSGTYERYYDYNDKRYSHILDCNTGSPIDNGIKSVTVICKNGALADALSTALCVMGVETAIKFVNSYDKEKLTIVLAYEKDGKNYCYTNAENYELLDNNYVIQSF